MDELVGRLRAKGAAVLRIDGSIPNPAVIDRQPDMIRMTMPQLPPNMVALDHATSAGNARRFEWSMPYVEELIGAVRKKR